MTSVLNTDTSLEAQPEAADGRSFFVPEHDPIISETAMLASLITEKVEADASLRGFITIGNGKYAVFCDPGRSTDTQNALFGIGDDKWIAYSNPSSPAYWDNETMRLATHGDNQKLITDITAELSAKLSREAKEEEDRLYRAGLADYTYKVEEGEGDTKVITFPKRNTRAARYYVHWAMTH